MLGNAPVTVSKPTRRNPLGEVDRGPPAVTESNTYQTVLKRDKSTLPERRALCLPFVSRFTIYGRRTARAWARVGPAPLPMLMKVTFAPSEPLCSGHLKQKVVSTSGPCVLHIHFFPFVMTFVTGNARVPRYARQEQLV